LGSNYFSAFVPAIISINKRKNLVQVSESKDDERYDNFIIAKKQEQQFLEKQN